MAPLLFKCLSAIVLASAFCAAPSTRCAPPISEGVAFIGKISFLPSFSQASFFGPLASSSLRRTWPPSSPSELRARPLISSLPSWPSLSPGFRFGFSSFLRCFLSGLPFRSLFQRRFFCPLYHFLRSLLVSLFRCLDRFTSHFGSLFDGLGCLVAGGFRHALCH